MSKNKMDFLPEYWDKTETYDEEILTYRRQFNQFCTNVFACLLNFNYEELYELTDKSMPEDLFTNYVKTQIGDTIELLYNNYSEDYVSGTITPIKPDPQNPLVGVMELFFFVINYGYPSGKTYFSSNLKTFMVPLLFKYKFNEFKLLPIVSQFDIK